MSGTHEELRELCAGFSLGVLDETDRLRLERHLSEGCAECEERVAADAEAAALLSWSAPTAALSPDFTRRVVAAARADGERAIPARPLRLPSREGRGFRWSWALAGTALAASIVAVVGLLRLQSELDAERRLAQQLADSLRSERRWAEVVSAPGARVANLSPTASGAPDLRGRAVYDPATRSAVLVLANAAAPSGRDYELWAIAGTQPRSLGVVQADEAGNAVVRLADVGAPEAIDALALSLEPDGGSPDPSAPSGPVVLLGVLER